MNATQHAHTRSQQRGIPPMVIDLLLQFGSRERAGDGCSKVFLDKRDRRRLEAYAGPLNRQLEPFMDIYLVVSPQDQVITAAHRIEKIKRI
jgi:hypothetical protein